MLTSDSAASALLLGLLALGATGLGWLARVQRAGLTDADLGAGTSRASPPGLAVLAGAAEAPQPPRRAVAPGSAWQVERGSEPGPDSGERLRLARSERDYLEAFLALEREAQGTLAAQAGERLEGPASRAEKVGLLRALTELDPAGSLHWLERSVRWLPASADANGTSVAAYALALLARRAPREEAARQALARLALLEQGLAPPLRRSAAAEYARTAPGGELDRLRPALARSNDALLVAGVLAVLEAREDTPRDSEGAARLLAEFGAERAPWPRAEE